MNRSIRLLLTLFLSGSLFGGAAPTKDEPSAAAKRDTIKRAIARHEVVPGMTEKEVGLAWGRPHQVYTRLSDDDVFKIWIYIKTTRVGYNVKREYRMVYILNGEVTSVSIDRDGK